MIRNIKYINWTKDHGEMLQNIMQINQGASFKSIFENFQNNDPNPMFNTEKIVRHIRYMKSKH